MWKAFFFFFKANKTFIVRIFFFHFFSFFYKNMHTYRGYTGPGEDTHACMHTNSLLLFHSHTHTHTHTHTFLLGPRPQPQKPRRLCQGSLTLPHVFHPLSHPLSPQPSYYYYYYYKMIMDQSTIYLQKVKNCNWMLAFPISEALSFSP